MSLMKYTYIHVCTCVFSGYGSYQPQASPYTQQPGAPVQVRAAGSFDQGARFDPNKAVSIPVSQLHVHL